MISWHEVWLDVGAGAAVTEDGGLGGKPPDRVVVAASGAAASRPTTRPVSRSYTGLPLNPGWIRSALSEVESSCR